MRSASEIKARCSPILQDEKLVGVVTESASPTAAYDLVFQQTQDEDMSKAARWLAVLRRDHRKEYDELVNGGKGLMS